MLLVLGLQAQTNFIGLSGGDWNISSNWSSGLPAVGNDALIPNGSTVKISAPLTVTFGIQCYGTIDNSTTLNIDKSVSISGSFINNGTLILSATNSFTTEFGSTFGNSASGIININGNFTNTGTLTNLGIINNSNVFNNNFTLDNKLTFNNKSGATVNNLATINNSGTYSNEATATTIIAFRFNNSGTANNAGIFNNNDQINNSTTGLFYNLAGSTLAVNYGAVITNDNLFTNYLSAKIFSNGSLNNNKTFTNQGIIESNSGGFIRNKAAFINSGAVKNINSITNDDVFTNSGVLENNSGGVFTNNKKLVVTVIGSFSNFYEIYNKVGANTENNGTFMNGVRVFNEGTFDNNGFLQNLGDFYNKVGGILNNNELIEIKDGGFINEGTVNNFKNLINGSCSSFSNKSVINNTGKFTNKSILFQRGTLTGNAILALGGIIQTGASSTANICRPDTVGSEINGQLKVYAQSFISKSLIGLDSCNSFLYFANGLGRQVLTCTEIGKTLPVNFKILTRTGDSLTCATSVFFVDRLNPEFSKCPDDILVYTNQSSVAVNWIAPTAIDNCSTVLTNTNTKKPGDLFQIGTTEVTYTSSDAYNNTNICKFKVYVKAVTGTGICTNDLQGPTITNCPTDIIKNVVSGGAYIDWTEPTFTDNCLPISVTVDNRKARIFLQDTTKITYTAKDANNNSSTCIFNVIINKPSICTNDVIAPTVTKCPANIFVLSNPATSLGTAIWDAPIFADACSQVTVTNNYNSGTSFPIGTSLVTYTGKDAKNNAATCSFNVTVATTDPCPTDVTSPVIVGCPLNINVNTTTNSSNVTWTEPTATDNCGGVSITSNGKPGIYTIGTTKITYTASDKKGNVSTCIFNINVINPCANDTVKPVFVNCPNAITTSTSGGSSIVNWTAPTASDNCGSATVYTTNTPGSSFPVGSNSVVYTVVDGNANTNSCTFVVTVLKLPSVPCNPPAGSLNVEVYSNIGTESLDNLYLNDAFPNAPTTAVGYPITSFASKVNWADNYGSRARGYIKAPATGSYTFYVSGDDETKLFLSTDTTAKNKALIANIIGYTDVNVLNKYPSQKSAPILLLKDNFYYIEVNQKEGGGGDHFGVSWTTPLMTTTSATNVVVNGDFEAGNTGFTTNSAYSPTLGDCGRYSVTSTPQTDWNWPSPCKGANGSINKMLIIDNPGYVNAHGWIQTVPVKQNTNYTFTAYATSIYYTSPARVVLAVNGVNLNTAVTLSTTTCGWVKITGTWSSGANTNANLVIKNENGDCAGNDWALDDISFTSDAILPTPVVIPGTVLYPYLNCGQDNTSCANNLITNPGFENGLSTVASWNSISMTTDAYNGYKAIKVGPTEGGFAANGQVPVKGATYSLNVFSKISDAPSWAGVGIVTYDINWATLSTKSIQVTSATYANYSVVSDAVPANAAYIYAYTWKGGAVGNIFVDDLCLTVNDPCANDVTPPTIKNCPLSASVTSATNSAIFTWQGPIASDNCGQPNLTSTHVSGATFNLGATVVTYTATDAKSNKATCSFTLTVTQACPTNGGVALPATQTISLTNNANGNVTTIPSLSGHTGNVVRWEYQTPNSTVWNNWGGTTTTAPGNCCFYIAGTWKVRAITKLGTCNELASTESLVVVIAADPCATDVTAPVFAACPANISLTTTTTSALASWTAPTATDNCGTPIITSTHVSGASFNLGVTTVSYTATDAKGNKATCSFTVTVTQIVVDPCATDITAPVFASCPANISLTTTSTSALANWNAPTATDNCSTPVVTSTHVSGASFNIGVTTVTYTATDGKGNKTTCSFTVSVTQIVVDPCATDVTAPVLSSCPSNISLSTTGTSIAATWIAPTATDNCGTPVVTSTHLSGTSFNVGITTVIYTATDAKGNKATCSFTVTVSGVTPTDICKNADANITPSGNTIVITGITTSSAYIQIFNNVWATIYNANVSSNSVIIPNLATGSYYVKVTVLSAGGQWPSLCESNKNVTVTGGTNGDPCATDVIVPVIFNCPANITVSTTATNATATWTAPTATDNCVTPVLTSTHVSGASFQVGLTTVTYTATDAKSNTATCSFTVKVENVNVCATDIIVPVFTGCPNNINLSTTGTTVVGTWTAPTATDNCGVPTITSTHVSGASFPTGTTLVSYTATDAKGNKATCSFSVIVTQTSTGGDLCSNPDANISVSSNIITIGGITTGAAYVQVFNASFATVFNNNVSGLSYSLPFLPTGTYLVKVTVLGAGGVWPSVCEKMKSIIITGTGTNPCTNDIEAPIITGCPSNLSVTTGGTSTNVNWIAPTITDNCSTPNVVSNYAPGANLPVGITTVTYTATDAKANKSTCSFTVTVIKDVTSGCSFNAIAGTGKIDFSGLTTNSNIQVFTCGWAPISVPAYTTNTMSLTVPNGCYIVKYWSLECGEKRIDLTITGSTASSTNTINKLLNLDAFQESNQVRLDWLNNTGTINNSFEVEKINTLGFWEVIGSKDAKQKANDYKVYTTIDDNPIDGENIYRIRLIFKDGSYISSNVVIMNYTKINKFNIYPNPADEYINVDLEDYQGKNINMFIYNSLGQVVKNIVIDGVNQSNERIETNSLNDGQYLIRIQTLGKKDVSKQFIIMK